MKLRATAALFRALAAVLLPATFASAASTTASRLGCPEFNGDARADIPWWHEGYRLVFTWEMQGSDVRRDYYVSGRPDDVSTIQALADFNGDGLTDVLWRNPNDGTTFIHATALYPHLGFGAKTNSQADLGWQVQAAGDFNGDGAADILWRKTAVGVDQAAMFVWLMKGATIIGAQYLDPISPQWQVQGIGDFNGDGRTDILWREQPTGNLYIWMMDGFSVSAGTGYTNSQADLTWKVDALGDLDGDGRTDIVWRHGGGALFVWLMDGTTITGAQYLDPVSLAWTIQGVGDFNGDGRSDILWREPRTAATYIWMMNGGTVIAGTGYTSHRTDMNWTVVPCTSVVSPLTFAPALPPRAPSCASAFGFLTSLEASLDYFVVDGAGDWSGWRVVSGSTGRAYTFPPGVTGRGPIRVQSGASTCSPSAWRLCWTPEEIWNDNGDTATLYDCQGGYRGAINGR